MRHRLFLATPTFSYPIEPWATLDTGTATCWQTSGMFGGLTNACASPRLCRRAARNARSRCDWSDERHGSACCPSFLRLNARPAACLIQKHHDDNGSRYDVRSHRDRHRCGLASARPLVLGAFREEHLPSDSGSSLIANADGRPRKVSVGLLDAIPRAGHIDPLKRDDV